MLSSLVLDESYNEVMKLVNAQMKEFFSPAGLRGGNGTVHAMGGNSDDDIAFPS